MVVITAGENSEKRAVVKNAKDSQVEQHLWFGNIPSIFLHRGELCACERA